MMAVSFSQLPIALPNSGTPLEAERAALVERIKKLPPNSHKRIGLQFKAQQLTHEILKAQNKTSNRDAQ